MSAVQRHDMAEHSPEWHAARRYRIGGSEIGAILGWSPWTTPDDLATTKLSGEIRPTTPRQQLGHDAEPMLAAWLERKLDTTIDMHPGTYIDDLAVANPDGICGDGWLFEAKTVDDRTTDAGWGRAGTATVPLHYAAQVEWYAGLLEAPGTHLVVLAGSHNGRPGLHIAHYKIPAHPAVYAYLRETALEWHTTHLAPALAAAA